jgi:hypothetical protein
MINRQDPYFRAAMRNERLEAECREFAAWAEKHAEEEAARDGVSSDSSESNGSIEERRQSRRRMWLAVAQALLEEADRHAQMRERMEPFL